MAAHVAIFFVISYQQFIVYVIVWLASSNSFNLSLDELSIKGGALVLYGGSDKPGNFCIDSVFALKNLVNITNI